MAVKGKTITILGAGIGGLTAAIALARRGGRVTVIEQAPDLTEVGAGIQISPNATAVLNALDLLRRVEAVASPLERIELVDRRGGRPLMTVDLAQAKGTNPHPYLAVHRADLIEVLAASARRHGVNFVFGKEATGVAVGFDQATLPLSDGTKRNCRILIGADGIRSLTRGALNMRKPPVFTGQIAWRALVDCRYVPIYDPAPVARVYMGPGRHLVTYPVRGGQLMNIVAVETRDTWAAEDWNFADDPDNLRAAFAGWHKDVDRMLSVVEEVKLWGLFAHPVAETWFQGGAVLMGDALHPTLPFLAQGANMAIEDAWVLTEEMDAQDDLQDAFAAYRTRREKRVRRIVAGASGNTKIYHFSTPGLRRGLHMGMRMVNSLASDRLARRYGWLYGHDVTRDRG